MKVISKKFASHWKGELVKREFEVWREMFGHKFIVSLHYSYSTASTFNFVMEFCPGGTLYQRIKQVKKIDARTAMVYFVQLLTVLEELHSKQIIYRDLKVVCVQ